MMQYINSAWQLILKENKLDNFDALWEVNSAWAEDPNHRRGGWSGVHCFDLNVARDIRQTVFLKKQSNHTCRTLFHPIKGIPTFRREINNILEFNKQGIATMLPLFYGEKKENGKWQALLVTKALDNYLSFDVYYERYSRNNPCKKENIKKIAAFIRNIHDKGFRYGCLYAKHIYVLGENNIKDICLIDLEKAKKSPFKKTRLLKDLSTLYRTMGHISVKDCMQFMKYYFNTEKLDRKNKLLIKLLIKRIKRKHR